LETFLHAKELTNLEEWLKVLSLVEVRYITGIEDVVDVLQHLLVDDLGVHKDESCGFIVNTSLHQGFLCIVSPVLHAVALNDLNRGRLVVRNEGGEPG
jgi:hypothetical protein